MLLEKTIQQIKSSSADLISTSENAQAVIKKDQPAVTGKLVNKAMMFELDINRDKRSQ